MHEGSDLLPFLVVMGGNCYLFCVLKRFGLLCSTWLTTVAPLKQSLRP